FEDPSAYKDKVIATDLPTFPRAAIGDAEAWHAKEKSVMVVRTETSAEDVDGMHAATGILTERDGLTSHDAVIARKWRKCCVLSIFL
ncbi:hypothetical protein HN873_068631, partial [Arachis hypogaea]